MQFAIASAVTLFAAAALAAPSIADRLIASDGGPDDEFGWSVAVDGDIALVGAAYATVDGHESQGAVYVFSRVAGAWTQTHKLVASDGAANAHFGASVAIDRDTAVIGADNAAVDGTLHRGAAYVFARSGASWSETQKIASSDGATFETFGHAVAIEGDRILVGNHGADVGAVHAAGAVYEYTRDGAAWAETEKIIADDAIDNDLFGYSIAFDGSRLLVGTDNATIDDRPGQGSAYVLEEAGDQWQIVHKLVASDGEAFDAFGWSVAIEGDVALVGARGVTIGDDTFRGAVYAYAFDGSTWNERQKLIADDGTAGAWFGHSLALRGATALVGAYGANVDDHEEQGAAYVFTSDGDAWTARRKLVAPHADVNMHFGNAVALVSETDALVGAVDADIDGNGAQGAVWAFDLLESDDVVFADGFDTAAR
ncbi:MAG: FG-GAP repeat protein [Rhodanobacteraceae bacterium]